MIKLFEQWLKESKLKKGDLVKIKPEWKEDQDSKYDFTYVLLGNPSGGRVKIKPVDSGLSIPPVENVKLDWIYPVKESLNESDKTKAQFYLMDIFGKAYELNKSKDIQKIVGKKFYYQKNGNWTYNTDQLKAMEADEIIALGDKIKKELDL